MLAKLLQREARYIERARLVPGEISTAFRKDRKFAEGEFRRLREVSLELICARASRLKASAEKSIVKSGAEAL